MQTKKDIRHLFRPSTWVKIENRAKREGKTPAQVVDFILANGVGLMPKLAPAPRREQG